MRLFSSKDPYGKQLPSYRKSGQNDKLYQSYETFYRWSSEREMRSNIRTDKGKSFK